MCAGWSAIFGRLLVAVCEGGSAVAAKWMPRISWVAGLVECAGVCRSQGGVSRSAVKHATQFGVGCTLFLFRAVGGLSHLSDLVL